MEHARHRHRGDLQENAACLHHGTNMVVKILWVICSFHPTERVLEEMLVYGSVKKLLVLLHIDGRSSTKDKVIKMIKLHGNSWKRYPCFPCELKEYMAFNL